MKNMEEWKQSLIDQLKNDPLFEKIIENDKIYDIDELLSEDFLLQISQKDWFTTIDIANILGVKDGSLRYYSTNLPDYIFPEDSPSSRKSLRFNALSAVKFKMIFTLKDSYKTAGLKLLLGIDGSVVREQPVSVKRDVSLSDNDATLKRLENLELAMKMMLQTGVFPALTEEDEFEQTKFKDRLKNYLGVSDNESLIKELDDITDRYGKVVEENNNLMEIIRKNREGKDVAKSIKYIQIENDVREELRQKAVGIWVSENKGGGLVASLFNRRKQIAEQEEFVQQYIKEHLPEETQKRVSNYENEVVDDLQGAER